MNTPPKILRWFLDQCCPDSRPDLKGDLIELYEHRVEANGRSFANRKLLLDTVTVVPLNFIIRHPRANKPIPMLRTNLKIARRNLAKNKMYSLINVSGLAVSLAICILITLFIRDELSFDKHFHGGENVYRIAGSYSQGGSERVMGAQTSYLVKPLVEDDVEGLEAITRVDFVGDVITVNLDKRYAESAIVFADSTFFEVFRIPLVKGDPATALNDPGSVVIDRNTAHKYFNTDDVLGKLIDLRGKQFAISGVMEPLPLHTHFECSIIFPISGIKQWYPDWVLTNFSGTSLYTYIRTRDQFDVPAFESTLGKLVKQRWQWDGDSAPKYFLQPLTKIHLESNLRAEAGANGSITTVYVFLATAIVILMLACINYINLTTAASFQRGKEVGMKKVLGSSTRMQIFQFQTESFLVATTAMIVALVLAKLAMPEFNLLSGKSITLNPFTDPWIGFGSLVLVVLLSVAAGATPALVLLRTPTIGMLTDKLKLKSSKSHLRSGLIVFQFSITIDLVISTLVVMDQIRFIRNSDLGIDPESVVLIPLPTQEISAKYEVLKTEMLRDPAVISVAASSNKVTEPVGSWRGYKPHPGKDAVSCSSIAVTIDFFETMKATMVEGRSFSKDFPTDVTTGYILNESAVKFFGLEQPVGRSLFGHTFTGSTWHERNGEILGVVNDFHFASLHSKVSPVVFYVASDLTESVDWMEVRVSSDNLQQTIQSLRSAWTNVAGDRSFEFEFMDEAIGWHYQAEERFLKIFTIFSMLSIMLGGLGLFGLTAFMAKRRTREIGIRRVMGASTAALVKVMSSDFLTLVMIANVVGAPIAYYFIQNWLKNFAYQVSVSAWIFAGACVGVMLIAFLCILFHSIKVSTINPVKSLRVE